MAFAGAAEPERKRQKSAPPTEQKIIAATSAGACLKAHPAGFVVSLNALLTGKCETGICTNADSRFGHAAGEDQ